MALSVLLGMFVNANFLWFTLFVGVNLFQSAFTNWCSMMPHEIDCLFFARCRMEPAWSSVHFTVDISESYERKQAAIAAYASVFHGDQARLVERYAAEDQYYGSLLGVRYAEPFQREVHSSSAIPRRSRKCRSGDHGSCPAPNPFLSVRLI